MPSVTLLMASPMNILSWSVEIRGYSPLKRRSRGGRLICLTIFIFTRKFGVYLIIRYLSHFRGDGNQGKMPLLINARWLVACQYQGTESFHVDHYFIATHIDTEDKQVIKHYDEHFEKIKELKPGQKGITSKVKVQPHPGNANYDYYKGYAIAVVMGDMEDQDPKLVHIRQVKGKKNYYWQLQRYRLSQNTFVRMDSIEIDFLTRINNFEDKSFISYMTSWSNQLYISDSGTFI